MKVILNDYIEHLGERGDSVTVKPGFARNYLLPKGLAYPDTPGNRKRFNEDQNHWEEMDLQRRSGAEKLAADLDGTKLLFERRAGEGDVLLGSVNVADIARELAALGFDIDRGRIRLEHAIKELGHSELVVHIHRDINVTIPIQVVRPGEEPDAAAPEFVAEGVFELPDEPEIDQAGEAAELAETPEVPEVQEVPEVPESSETPEVPETPEASEPENGPPETDGLVETGKVAE